MFRMGKDRATYIRHSRFALKKCTERIKLFGKLLSLCLFNSLKEKTLFALCYEQTSPLAVPRTASGTPYGLSLSVLHYFFFANCFEKMPKKNQKKQREIFRCFFFIFIILYFHIPQYILLHSFSKRNLCA